MLWMIFVFILGCIFGSFFYVVGTRLPNGESLVKPGSHCTFCQHPLSVLDLVPLFSYVFLRGKCRYCHHKLSMEYFVYELFTGFLFLISYVKFSISYEFFVMLLISSLVVLIFITDFKYMIILDSPLIVSSICMFGIQWIFFGFVSASLRVLEGICVFFTMLAIGKIGNFLFKKESLGGGDIKFSFVMGLLLGYKYALVALVFSTFLALPYAIGTMFLKKDNEVPFGPFLVSSVALVFFFGEKFQYIFYFI